MFSRLTAISWKIFALSSRRWFVLLSITGPAGETDLELRLDIKNINKTKLWCTKENNNETCVNLTNRTSRVHKVLHSMIIHKATAPHMDQDYMHSFNYIGIFYNGKNVKDKQLNHRKKFTFYLNICYNLTILMKLCFRQKRWLPLIYLTTCFASIKLSQHYTRLFKQVPMHYHLCYFNLEH